MDPAFSFKGAKILQRFPRAWQSFRGCWGHSEYWGGSLHGLTAKEARLTFQKYTLSLQARYDAIHHTGPGTGVEVPRLGMER